MSESAFPAICPCGISCSEAASLAPEGHRFFSSRRGACGLREGGFTVLELVVVMLVLGILTVVVLPRLSLFDGYDQLGYRDRVRATLEYARKAAVAQRRNVQVTLTASSVTVMIASDIPEGAGGTTYGRNLPLPGSTSHTFSAPAGVTLSPPAVLAFDPLGKPSAGGSFTITGSGAPIVVEAETGHVH